MTNYNELFTSMPVGKAVAKLAIPTVVSQIIVILYSLADTFFIGQIGDPAMVAGATLVSPWFNLLTALSNLVGIGGISVMDKLLGRHEYDDVKKSLRSVFGRASSCARCSAGSRLPLRGRFSRC